LWEKACCYGGELMEENDEGEHDWETDELLD